VGELETLRAANLQPPRLPKMAELIADQLRKQIVRGDLTEGQALPSEAELLERFNVSRPTLREAFRVLESESLITVRRGAHGGARVQVPNIDVAARYAGFVLEHRDTTLADVYEARILIEPPIVGLLASRRTDEDVRRLRVALEEHEAAAHAPMVAIRTHTAFHALLVELTGNQTLRVLTGMVQHIIDRANWDWVESKAATPEETGISLGLRAHHRVVDLIEAGVESGAEEVWRKHLTEARDYLLRPDRTTVLDLMS
jgi:GntR family transcriptional regulator, transcriptional repressor for pyruvate dehydrogenase complex